MPGIRPFTGRKLTVGRVRGVYTPPTGGGGGGGPAFRSISSAGNVVNVVTCSMPTGVATGDILVAQVCETIDNKAGGFGTAPAGWTARQTSALDGNSQIRTSVYTKTAGASETAFVWTGAANVYASTVTVMAVSGAASIDVVGTFSNSDTVAPSVTATGSSSLLIGMWSTTSGPSPSWTAPASMTRRSNFVHAPSNSWNTSFATQTLSSSGATGTRTATNTATAGNKYATLLAVK